MATKFYFAPYRFLRPVQRPERFTLDPTHFFHQGSLKFAGLGAWPGLTQFYDSSGDVGRAGTSPANHGTLTNMDPATDWVWTPQLGRWATDYAGNDDCVQNNTFSYNCAYPFTLAAWAKSSSDTALMQVVLAIGQEYNKSFRIGFDSTDAAVAIPFLAARNTTLFTTLSPTDVGLGVWIHLCGVFKSATARDLYVKGVLVASGTDSVTPLTTGNRWCLGSNTYTLGTVNRFEGRCCDALVANRIFSPAEIAALADPSNVLLSGLIVPARRRLWGVTTGGVAVTSPWYARMAIQRNR